MLTPFDGRKVAYHLPYWAQMASGKIPPPVLVTLDPINRCNLKCQWCNASETISPKGQMYSEETIKALPSFLKDWGVKAVCVAGGGEPLLHKQASQLIHGLTEMGLEVGVVTNGALMNRHMEALGRCRWVGVSVDAGTPGMYHRLKGADLLAAVVANIRALRSRHPGLEITWKYLLCQENRFEVATAAEVAKVTGCTYFHARPAGITWADIRDGIEPKRIRPEHIAEINAALMMAKHRLDGPTFSVQAYMDKFTSDWRPLHNFRQCWAMGMTCVIQPDGTAGLCCDRRGDLRAQLTAWNDLSDIKRAWGSGRHLEVISNADLADCPRCTYSPHNELFEAFIVSDATCKNFI